MDNVSRQGNLNDTKSEVLLVAPSELDPPEFGSYVTPRNDVSVSDLH